MSHSKSLLISALAVILAIALLVPAPASACTTGGGGGVIIFHNDGTIWIIIFNLATAAPADMDACLAGLQTNGVIGSVDHVALVNSATGKPFSGYSFEPHQGITKRLSQITGPRSGQWQGFYSNPRNPPAAGLEAELHFDVRLAPDKTPDDLIHMLRNGGLIANGSASSRNYQPDFHHFTIQRPESLVVLHEDGELQVFGGEPKFHH